MYEWHPHLIDLFGATRLAGRQVQEVLAFARLLQSPAEHPLERLSLAERFEALDIAKRVFLLPWLLELLSDPFEPVRKRVLQSVSTLSGEQFRQCMDHLSQLLEATSGADDALEAFLSDLDEVLIGEAGLDLQTPFRALPALRTAVVATSLLLGISRWIRRSPARHELAVVLQNHFAAPKRAEVRACLHEWLLRGPLFLRFLLLRWIGESGITTSEEGTATGLLRGRYEHEADALLVATAAEAYARSVSREADPEQVKRALAFLQDEHRWVSRRAPEGFRTEGEIKTISIGILRALAKLAMDVDAVETRRAWMEVLEGAPCMELDLFDPNVPADDKERMFSVGLRLHRQSLLVRVFPHGQGKSCWAGVKASLAMSDPDRLLDQPKRERSYWALPVPPPNAQGEPREWTFQLVRPWKGSRPTQDLRGLVSPLFTPFRTPRGSRPDSRDASRRDVEARGQWMLECAYLCAELLRVKIPENDSATHADCNYIYEYLRTVSLVVATLPYSVESAGDRSLVNQLKATTEEIFLTVLSRNEVFADLFPTNSLQPAAAQLLVGLCQTALDMPPGTLAKRWISGNRATLWEICGDRGFSLWARAVASMVVRLEEGGRRFDRATFEGRVPDGNRFHAAFPPAVAFVSDEALAGLLQPARLNPDAELTRDRLANCAEFVARAIESDWSENVEQVAALCLASFGGRPARAAQGRAAARLHALSRRRLLGAYAASRSPLKGNVRRLLTWLLRTSSAAELFDFLASRQAAPEAVLDGGLLRYLVTILDEHSSPLYDGRPTRGISSREWRGRWIVALRALTSEARETGDDFFSRYGELRFGVPRVEETPSAVGVRGNVLPASPGGGELLVVGNALSRQEDDLGRRGADIVPAFVHHTSEGGSLTCLAAFVPLPVGTLDFHALLCSGDENRRLLEERLMESGRCLVAGRVLGPTGDGRWRVDLGVGSKQIPRITHLRLEGEPALDTVIITELRRTAPVVFDDLRFSGPVSRFDEASIVDLRDAWRADRRLETEMATATTDGRKLLLRVTVANRVSGGKDGKQRCVLDTGFRLWDHDRQRVIPPVLWVDADRGPVVGDEILVQPHIRVKRPQRWFSLVQCSTYAWSGLAEGQHVQGVLEPEPNAEPVRRWSARVGGRRLPLPRARLTTDLSVLFRLDAAGDTPTLLHSTAAPRTLRVTDGGRALSLVDAEPRWRVHDLMLALAAGQVDTATFVRREPQAPALVFEVFPCDQGVGATPPFIPPFGTMVRVAEEDLFDENGFPLASARLRPGVRLALELRFGRPRMEGGYAVAEAQGTAAEPFLACVAVDEYNLQLQTAIGGSVDVEIVQRVPLVLRAVDALFNRIPSPAVVVAPEDEAWFQKAEGVVTARVDSEWNPWSDTYELAVAPPNERSLFLERRNLARDVRELVDLKPGDRLRHHVRFTRDGSGLACSVGFLPVKLDALVHYLVPSQLTVEKLRNASRLLSMRVTGVTIRRAEDLGDLEAYPQLPWADLEHEAIGLVVGIPGTRGATIHTARWLLRGGDGQRDVVTDEWQFEPPAPLQLGDLLRVGARQGRQVLLRTERVIYGTTLHQAETLDRMDLRGKGYEATLIRRPENADRNWLLAIAPSLLVRVPAEQVKNAEFLTGARPLDRIQVDFVRTGRVTQAVFQRTDPGQIRSALRKTIKVTVSRPIPATRQFPVAIPGGTLGRYPWLNLLFQESELPVQNVAGLLDRLRNQPKVELSCILVDCHLDTIRLPADPEDTGPAYQFALKMDLVDPSSDMPASDSEGDLPLLGHALSGKPRKEGVPGQVVKLGLGQGVRLTGYAHPDPLPLPPEEQTWIRFTGRTATTGSFMFFSLLKDPQGRVYPSLRRKPPLTLEAWLKEKQWSRPGTVVNKLPLFYYGRLEHEQAVECGMAEVLADPAEDPNVGKTEYVLFEAGPGDTFFVLRDRVRIMGEPFGSDAMRRGDIVREFRITLEHSESSEAETDEAADDALVLDIARVEIDFRYEIERFHEQKGIFIGLVARQAGQLTLNDVRGGGYSPNSSVRSRKGGWRLVLQEPSSGWPAWVEQVQEEGEDMYLRLAEVNENDGIMVFILLDTSTVFELNNLVYVRAVKAREREGVAKLLVRSLDRRHDGRYVIPDNRFSERRGKLLPLIDRELKDIYLAKVIRRDRDSAELPLACTDVPARRFSYLLSAGGQQQAIVKPPFEATPPDTLVLELGVSVNVELPWDRVDGWRPDWGRRPQPGDVLLLQPDPAAYRITVVDFIRGHLHYLQPKRRPTVLTTLWGNPDRRVSRLLEAKSRLPNCNLVGYAQLRGVCEVSRENLVREDPVPQQVKELSPDGRWVTLTDTLDEGAAAVGRLALKDGRPVLLTAGEEHPLGWGDITFREGTPAELAAHLSRLQWHNRAAHGTGAPEGISRSDVVALKSGNGAPPSLTAQAEWPMPVDHLIEQFPLCRAGEREPAKPQAYVVARVTPDRMVLEVAPGRFAELPFTLLQPIEQGQLRPNHALRWSFLDRGDVIALERVSPLRASHEDLLSYFRVTRIHAGSARHFSAPFVSSISRTSDGVFIGPSGGGIAAEKFVSIADERNVYLDLTQFSRRERYPRVREAFDQLGHRLLLKVGEIRHYGPRVFFPIGATMEVPGRGARDPSWMPTGVGRKPEEGEAGWHLRVLSVGGGRGDWLDVGFEFVPEPPESEWLPKRVRWDPVGQRLRRWFGGPERHDSVMVANVGTPDTPDYRAVGLEGFELRWVENAADPLLLHLDDERQVLFDRLFSSSNTVLWATVEQVDEQNSRLLLSRRRQLEQVLPGPGEVARARRLGALDSRRLLVDVLGVPALVHVSEYCVGSEPDTDLATLLPFGGWRGGEMEITRDGATLTATGTYRLPATEELDAVVEASATCGVLAVSHGVRIYVPVRELSWCELSPALVRQLFAPGTRLKIARPASSGSPVFSCIRTQDVREEVAGFVSRPDDPVYVTSLGDSTAGNRRVVRGRSGILMELHLYPGEEMPERTCAYVQRVDSVARRIILRLEEPKSGVWLFPPIEREFFADTASEQFVQLKRRQLDEVMDAGIGGLAEWIRVQYQLEPSPRNLKLLLEAVWKRTRNVEWELLASDRAAGSALGRVWNEVCAFFASTVAPEELSPLAHFGVCYWLLLADRAPAALWHAQRAVEGSLCNHFDVWFVHARALYVCGEGRTATQQLLELCNRLWANSLVTLPLPLPKPSSVSASDMTDARWERAFEAGNLQELEAYVSRSALMEPGSPESEFARVWLRVQYGQMGAGFDTMSNEFLALLRDEIYYIGEVSPHLYLFATVICFARGDVLAGWEYLSKASNTADSQWSDSGREVARFWNAWLADQPCSEADPFLVALRPLYGQCRYRETCDSETFANAWKEYRQSLHRWVMTAPRYRIVPSYPDDTTGLYEWARRYGSNDLMASLTEKLSFKR